MSLPCISGFQGTTSHTWARVCVRPGGWVRWGAETGEVYPMTDRTERGRR